MPEGFVHLKRQQSNESDDDRSTLIPDGTDKSALDPELPASVMYIPEVDDFSTLVDGQPGSSKAQLGSSGNNLAQTKALAASIHQLQYNEYKIALDRSINSTIELLYELSDENNQRPMFYPIDNDQTSYEDQPLLNSQSSHLALLANDSSLNKLEKSKPSAQDSLPQFKIIRLDLKNGPNQDNLVANLDKKSIATLLTKKLSQQVKYLLNLKDRVDNTTSKVFVTGDLNSGKSTFCNALLRRKVLPEDQQPCTAVFCEVIDASKENNGVEEVHAIEIDAKVPYDINDENSYEKHSIENLKDLVYEFEKYELLKVYVLDQRSFEQALLHNGVIDIKLIDAPGLNLDSYQTTQVFSRQEEIDLIVFVVNSENHFTQSAKEFIRASAAEKRYVFIVVNKFDNIKNKERCKQRILEQVKELSPDTYKNAQEFIHFVSSEEVLENGSGPDGNPDDDDPQDPENNRGDPNFDHLEASLRKFILEKRAISKLLPAKSYLVNILGDLESLSKINQDIYIRSKEQKVAELKNQISPKYNEILSTSIKISETINSVIESTYNSVYDDSRKAILNTVSQLGSTPVPIKYPGLSGVFEYAKETQSFMITSVMNTLKSSEEAARKLTSLQVDEIIKYGQSTLGEEFLNDKVFNPELMFSKRRDSIIKSLNESIEISDFFDPSIESFLLWAGVPPSFVSTTRDQIEYYNPVGFIANIPSNVVALKESVPSQLTLHTIYSSGKILTTGALIRKFWDLSHVLTPTVIKQVAIPIVVGISGITFYYLLNDIPNAFPRNQARKIKQKIHESDYPHINASRIAKECQRVLNYPSRQVMNNFQTSIDKRSVEKEKLENEIKSAEISCNYFTDLLNKVNYQQGLVKDIDIESINTVD